MKDRFRLVQTGDLHLGSPFAFAPAQADLLIGIGANDEYMGQELRMLTLIKNKIGAMEESFPVKINRPLSRYLNV